MPSHTRPAAPKEIISTFASRASLLVAIGLVASTTACAVQMDGEERTGEQELAAKLPPGGGGDTKPPIDWPSVLDQLVEISAGNHHTCVRKLNGNVYCWGLTSYGQAGPANTTCLSGFPCVTQPQSVGIKAQQVDLGYDHSCVVERFGSGRCWGANHNAQLGNGSVVITPNLPASSQPVAFNGSALAFSSLSAGSFTSCGIEAGTGQVFCWGMAGPGAYPAGSGVSTPNPLRNGGGIVLDRIDAISTSHAGACITFNLTNGAGTENYCFVGTNANGNSNPVYSFDQSALRISTQSTFTCADKANGTVECFGYGGEGQLGDGAQTNSSTPVLVGNGMPLHGVSAGDSQACALDPAGTVHCWGNLSSGGSTTPVAVSTPVPLTSVAAGGKHACGLGNDGNIYCWGSNTYGQLGAGSWTKRPPGVVRANTPS
jgi:hypothetical protein